MATLEQNHEFDQNSWNKKFNKKEQSFSDCGTNHEFGQNNWNFFLIRRNKALATMEQNSIKIIITKLIIRNKSLATVEQFINSIRIIGA
jgi:hypothetical protein